MSEPRDDQGFPQPNDDFGVANPFVSPVAVQQPSEGMVSRSDEPLNPWISMWLHARETVRQQLDHEPTKHVLLLAVLAGAAGQLGNNMTALAPDFATRLASLVGILLGGAVMMLVWLFVAAWVVGMTGRALGGVATALECRTALAWSMVPTLWMAPLNLVFALFYLAKGRAAVAGPAPGQPPNGPAFWFEGLPPWLMLLMAVGMIVGLWQLVIMCQSVGEAHRFSSLRGFGSILLAMVAFAGLMMGVALVVGVLIAVFAMVAGA